MVQNSGNALPKLRILLFGLLALHLSSHCSAATIVGDPVSLSTLVDNPTGNVIAGDQLFSQFSYVSTGEMPTATGVNVYPIRDDDGNYGIRFQGVFVDIPSTSGGSDALIQYQVSPVNPLFVMSESQLAGPTALSGSSGAIYVTESFLPLSQYGAYTMEIYSDPSRSPQQKSVDSTYFQPAAYSLNVLTDILAVAGDTMVLWSFIDQTFSQQMPDLSNLDYNNNCFIDTADYTVWRDTLGSTSDLRADGNFSSVVDVGDYDLWKSHFNKYVCDFTSPDLSIVVPEPGLSTHLAVAILFAILNFGLFSPIRMNSIARRRTVLKDPLLG
ncbi:MAG: hypothetical protein WD971_01755 [Pirellulales bacterium]